MFRFFFSFLLGVLFFSLQGVFAEIKPDTQLLDQVGSGLKAQELKFTQATSCESLEAVLKKYAKKHPPIYRGRFGDMVNFAKINDAVTTQEATITSSKTDFSQTNIQKNGVDEPELLKTDGRYFYYYSVRTNKIIIVASPLDIKKSVLEPKKVKILNEIAIPTGLENVELFVSGNRLVIMGNYWANNWNDRYVFTANRTIVALYDISNIHDLKLLKFENLPGNYHDARLIDNELYVVSEQWFNRYAWDQQKNPLQKSLKSITITTTGKEENTVDCSQISYVLPKDEKLNLDPVFTLISAIDIQNVAKKTETTALLSPKGELHMTQNSLYLVSDFYTPSRWHCPSGMLCALPFFRGNVQTMIHKFDRKGLTFNYKNTALVPGSLLTQYSMDEDTEGNFRILTKTWDPELKTDLFVFSPNLQLAGKLENIAPGEEFKSSRYIGDKLYLVTFKQIDPLFVIDMKDNSPKILGELKIPGYSTYLHPLKKEKNKQYLLGIGYNTAENEWGGTINSGVKLSLFEVDYAKKDKNQISLKELDSLIQGGNGSRSEALHNPRLFVMDKQGNVTLPLYLSEDIADGETCTISYTANGKEQEKKCHSRTKRQDTFLGLKSFNISPEKGIKEIFAKDYLKNNIKRMSQFSSLRVGYAGDALYLFSPTFVDFIYPNQTNTFLEFK